MSVVVAHEVRRRPVPSPNLDDLGRLVGRTGRPAVHAQPVTYYCTHDNSSQGSYPAACTFPRIGGRGRRHRRGIGLRSPMPLRSSTAEMVSVIDTFPLR